MTAFGIFALEYTYDHVTVNGWLESFDTEANDGGFIQFRPSSANAMRFASMEEAVTYIDTIPTTRPLREDGKPNRPLGAFEIEIRQPPVTQDGEA